MVVLVSCGIFTVKMCFLFDIYNIFRHIVKESVISVKCGEK